MEEPGVPDAKTTLIPVTPVVAEAGIAIVPDTLTGVDIALGVENTFSPASNVPFLFRSIKTATP
jgi:hypothetical protein